MYSVGFDLIIPNKQPAADPRHRPPDHRDRLVNYIVILSENSQHIVFTGAP